MNWAEWVLVILGCAVVVALLGILYVKVLNSIWKNASAGARLAIILLVKRGGYRRIRDAFEVIQSKNRVNTELEEQNRVWRAYACWYQTVLHCAGVYTGYPPEDATYDQIRVAEQRAIRHDAEQDEKAPHERAEWYVRRVMREDRNALRDLRSK